MTWEQGVIGRITCQRQSQVDIVTVTIGNQEVLPVFQHITLIGQGSRELEIVIRPAQTLTPSNGDTQQFHIFIVIKETIIVIVAAVV